MNEEFKARRERMWRVVHNRNRSNAAARFDTSDVLQESEIQIWKDKLAPPNSPPIDSALITTIAKGHLAKNLRRHNAQKRNVELEQPLDGEPASSIRPPEEELQILEASNQILAAINQLCENERIVIFNRFFRSKTLKEIAEQLELTREQVKTRYKRAIQQLRKILVMDGLL